MVRKLLLSLCTVIFFLNVTAQEANVDRNEHYVPALKNLSEEWKERLYARGERKVYRGDELYTIGMPCGGVGAGQLYVRGDGTLARWWIFSDWYETTFYKKIPFTNYLTYRPASEIDQGFVISAKVKGKEAVTLPLSQDGFNDIAFIGEYPIATINYEGAKETFPLKVSTEVYSPFIPLDTKNSALPATIMSFEVKNVSDKKVEVSLGGWLQNAAIPKADSSVYALRKNEVVKSKNWVATQLKLESKDGMASENNHYEIIDDFESIIARADGTSVEQGDLSVWRIEGKAFGQKAASLSDIGSLGSRDFMYNFKGNQGQHVLFSLLNGRDKVGKVSREISIKDKYLSFLIAGVNRPAGNNDGELGVRLVIDGKVIFSATGSNNWQMRLVSWDVSDYMGKEATIEVVDESASAGIAVDYFRFSNFTMEQGKMFPSNHKSFGDMTIAVLDGDGTATANYGNRAELIKLLHGKQKAVASETAFITDSICGAAGSSFTLKANESRKVNFLITWYFPNLQNNAPGCPGDVGRMYDNWFDSSTDVVDYVSENFTYLSEKTHTYRDAMYLETSLPYWLTQRIASSSANMASAAVEWWRNGRMYSWEGVGFCHGTCGHVWNYTQTPSHLFPELERSVRLMQDFNEDVSLNEDGRINFRGFKDGGNESFEVWGYIPDAQSGYVLKAYREHLMATNYDYLNTIYPKVKLALQYLMVRDERYGELNGVLEGIQHLTDNITFGANSYTGTLYCAALRAGEKMAIIQGDEAFAEECHKLYFSGQKWMLNNIWNGEYFTHAYTNPGEDVMEKETGKRYLPVSMEDGCLADQVFGQNWAHQLGLGYILPKEVVDTALTSVYKYNWTPRMETIYEVMKRRFIFLAEKEEAGMVGLTYPHGIPKKRLSQNDDPWTGYEYQVASHMMYEGLLDKALSIAYGIHGRYDGTRHNPWNEIEGGDHYTRSMAAWGMLLNISGYIYDGPAGKIGFSPRITPEHFKCFFSGAEGWGSYLQERTGNQQKSSIELKWGTLNLNKITLELPADVNAEEVFITINDKKITTNFVQNGKSLKLNLEKELKINGSDLLKVVCKW